MVWTLQQQKNTKKYEEQYEIIIVRVLGDSSSGTGGGIEEGYTGNRDGYNRRIGVVGVYVLEGEQDE